MVHLRAGSTRALGMGVLCALAFAALPCAVFAGGGPESTVVVIDPGDPDSLYIGNHYVASRKVPARNVVYLDLEACHYADFANYQLEALLGEMSNRGIDGHVDYVVFATSRVYRVPGAGYLSDPGCLGVHYLSLSSVFTMARMANAILAGDADEDFGLRVIERNGYFSEDDSVVAFDGQARWVGGVPTDEAGAPRYLIGAMLGYTGPRGNTPGEIISMIDRSVSADGTQPEGTFYYMTTFDWARTGPRQPYFEDAIDAISAMGGNAEDVWSVLPDWPVPQHDCLGIMTGWPDPEIADADMTILPGAYCDHLTSWAATFDKNQQTKVSAWIGKGASGSWGAVEEPCADGGKFPHPRMFVYYYQGLSLGESVLRSLKYVPFQGLLYGDPLTQPFAQVPEIRVIAYRVPNSDIMIVWPKLESAAAGVGIERFDLFIDGKVVDSVAPGPSFVVALTGLEDGVHEFRVVGYDDTSVATQTRWTDWVEVDNVGRSVTLSVDPSVGDLSTEVACTVSANGGAVAEIRVLQNERVVASTGEASDTLAVSGEKLGAGPVQLIAEAVFEDGETARSAIGEVFLDFGGACCLPSGTCSQYPELACEAAGGVYAGDGTSCAGAAPCTPGVSCPVGESAVTFGGSNSPPVAYGYSRDIESFEPSVVELPVCGAVGGELTYTVLTPPAQATVEGSGPIRIVRPMATASGTDSLVFQVSAANGASEPAVITLHYPPVPPDTFTVTVDTLGEPEVPILCEPADVGGVGDHVAPFTTSLANNPGVPVTLTAPEMLGISPFVHWVVDGEVLLDGPEGTVFLAHNTTVLATYLPARCLEVWANRPGIAITVDVADINGQDDGIAPFDRVYAVTDGYFRIYAPDSVDGRSFLYWQLDGEQAAPGTSLVVPFMAEHRQAVAVYMNDPGDTDGDDDVDLMDMAVLQACFSGSPDGGDFVAPSPACLTAFDVASPADGAVDLADVALLAEGMGGPCESGDPPPIPPWLSVPAVKKRSIDSTQGLGH